MAHTPGIFAGFNFDPEVEMNIIDHMIWGREGEIVHNADTHKFGIVFVEHRDAEHMREQAPNLQTLLSARILTQ